MAGTLEHQLADVLTEGPSPQQQQEPAEPGQPASTPLAGEAVRPSAQLSAAETPAGPERPADSAPAGQASTCLLFSAG